MNPSPTSADVAIVGAGAAGLATAIFAARANPNCRIIALDGAKKLGSKILISGGGRCNVTNAAVAPADFFGGNPRIIQRILRAFPADETVAFFKEIGVLLHEEPLGKLFPDSNSAKTVIDALLREARRLNIDLLTDRRVTHIEPGNPFTLVTPAGPFSAKAVVLATGGLSYPKTGSDGHGLRLARDLGHTIVPTTPALAPLLLDGDFHAALSGISQDVELTIRAEGDKPVRLRGAMLWTHFGASGPVILDASRFWHRARLENRPVSITINFLPGQHLETAETWLLDQAARQPRARIATIIAERLPARVAESILSSIKIPPATPMAHLSKEARRRLLAELLSRALPIRDSRGYAHAEVTAGGVPLDEIDPATMQSRVRPGLYLVGEILDAEARIGGFNFQWAWSTGFVAGAAVAASCTSR